MPENGDFPNPAPTPSANPTPGLFIAFEGGEGAGKTTHSRQLQSLLTALGYAVLLIREPGGTGLGEHLRAYLKSDQALDPRAEMLLFGAARAQLVQERILPALQQGRIVLADRYAASTLAYQGSGRGLPQEFLREMNDQATQYCYPHLNLLLDLPPELGLSRSAEEQTAFAIDLQERTAPLGRNATGRRFDDLPLATHERIRAAFLALASADCQSSWEIIDAAQPRAQTAEAIWQAVEPWLPALPAAKPAPYAPQIPQPLPGLQTTPAGATRPASA